MSKINLDKYFEEFVSTPVVSAVLKAGTHVVTLLKVLILHSFANIDGSVKNKEYDHVDPNPQLGVLYGNDSGAIIHRYALLGYVKYDELTPKQKESDKFTCSAEGYALNAKRERLPDAKRTEDCRRILSRVFASFDLPAGSGIADLENVIGTGKTVTIDVKEVEGTDKPYFEVAKVSRVKVGADISAETFA